MFLQWKIVLSNASTPIMQWLVNIGVEQCKSIVQHNLRQSSTHESRVTTVMPCYHCNKHHAIPCPFLCSICVQWTWNFKPRMTGAHFQIKLLQSPSNSVKKESLLAKPHHFATGSLPTSPGAEGNLPSCTLSLFRTRSSFTKSGRIAKFCDTWPCFRIRLHKYLEYICLYTFPQHIYTYYTQIHMYGHLYIHTLPYCPYLHCIHPCRCACVSTWVCIQICKMNLVGTNLWCVYVPGQRICIST